MYFLQHAHLSADPPTHMCTERNANAGSIEKQVTRKKGLRVPVNPQKAVCENALMWLKRGVGIEKAVLLFKFDLHMFYFVINSLTFSVPAEAVTVIDKGTEEIKRI